MPHSPNHFPEPCASSLVREYRPQARVAEATFEVHERFSRKGKRNALVQLQVVVLRRWDVVVEQCATENGRKPRGSMTSKRLIGLRESAMYRPHCQSLTPAWYTATYIYQSGGGEALHYFPKFWRPSLTGKRNPANVDCSCPVSHDVDWSTAKLPMQSRLASRHQLVNLRRLLSTSAARRTEAVVVDAPVVRPRRVVGGFRGG